MASACRRRFPAVADGTSQSGAFGDCDGDGDLGDLVTEPELPWAHRKKLRLTGFALVAFLGCSYTVRGPASPYDPSMPPNCDRHAPIRFTLDLVGGIAAFSAALLVGSVRDLCGGDACTSGETAATYGVVAALGVIGGAHFHAMSRGAKNERGCQEAHRQHDAWKERAEEGTRSGRGADEAREGDALGGK